MRVVTRHSLSLSSSSSDRAKKKSRPVGRPAGRLSPSLPPPIVNRVVNSFGRPIMTFRLRLAGAARRSRGTCSFAHNQYTMKERKRERARGIANHCSIAAAPSQEASRRRWASRQQVVWLVRTCEFQNRRPAAADDECD